MDSSKSYLSSSGSASSSGSGSGRSIRNNLLPPRKRYKSFTLKDDNDITRHSTPPKRHQFSIPKDDDNDTASRTINTWRKLHEINLLKHILQYYNENGTYPFDTSSHMQKFYKGWFEQRGVYVDEDAFNNKMVELPERFFMNQRKTFVFGENIYDWMDPVEVKIYLLSFMIWGNKDNDGDDDQNNSSSRANEAGSSGSLERV